MRWEPGRYTLVADIGGTNTRVALADGVRVLTETVKRYKNAAHSELAAVLRAHLSEHDGVDCIGACVALAGPVTAGRGTLTNLDWTVESDMLRQVAKTENVGVFNDLQAQGYGLPTLGKDMITCLAAGRTGSNDTTQLVVGVGTGFNAAVVVQTPSGPIVPPSEAGHTNLPAHDAQTQDFISHLKAIHAFASVEDVLSGRGLENIYRWLSARDTGTGTGGKIASEIVASAKTGGDPLSMTTLAMFSQMLGVVAGNLALIHLPFGGVYLVGGVARALSPQLVELGFHQTFCAKGRFSELMERFPIHVIEDDYAALTGCATYLFEQTQKNHAR